MNTTVKALLDYYVKLGGSLSDTYESIADGEAIGNYTRIPDCIEACVQKAGSGGGGGGGTGIEVVQSIGDLPSTAEDGTVCVVLEDTETKTAVSFPAAGEKTTFDDSDVVIDKPSYTTSSVQSVFDAFVQYVSHYGFTATKQGAVYHEADNIDYYSYDSGTDTYTYMNNDLTEGQSVEGMYTRDMSGIKTSGVIEADNKEIYVSILPVGDDSISELKEAGLEDIDDSPCLEGVTATYPYGIYVSCEDWYADGIAFFAYLFEDVEAFDVTLQSGWTVARGIDETPTFEHIDSVSDVYPYIGYAGYTVNLFGVGYPNIYDGIVAKAASANKNGLYVRLDETWKHCALD